MTTQRADSAARSRVLGALQDDHKRVRKGYREFVKLGGSAHPERCAALVRQVLHELWTHARLEEELLYPAARGAIAGASLLDEAEVEHASAHALIEQLLAMEPGDAKYAARFVVLCEHVAQHVKEEEGKLFAQLERARIDWQALEARLLARRAELEVEALTAGEGGAAPAAVDAVPAADAAAVADDGPTTGTKSLPRGRNQPAVSATGGRTL